MNINQSIRDAKSNLKYMKAVRRRLFWLKITNLRAGFYERLCLANGYSKGNIKNLANEYGVTCEEVCEEEVMAWQS
ncbi:hypothetical protein [Lentibacillus salicampi]|uniref:Uncharacterized protein n=1 Tax=Lentibacillus salicampi TaxID=175306 RepID=A0A4Y9ABZ7_9BACI|nr:hypothetical protein [Lentibacillus salicampi]TFJ92832.1 hypothetical protein E4U82_09805 [Lentibacillus salicampi]